MLKIEYVCSNPEEFKEYAKNFEDHQIKIENVTVTDERIVILFFYMGPLTPKD